jgi:hypothetical protein
VNELFKTDHKLLLFSFEGYGFLSKQIYNRSKKHNLTRKVYNYDDIDDDVKEKFKIL